MVCRRSVLKLLRHFIYHRGNSHNIPFLSFQSEKPFSGAQPNIVPFIYQDLPYFAIGYPALYKKLGGMISKLPRLGVEGMDATIKGPDPYSSPGILGDTHHRIGRKL